MAIATTFNTNWGFTSANTTSYAGGYVTVPSGTTMLIIGIASICNGGAGIANVSILNSTNFTQFGSAYQGSGAYYVSLWYLYNPPSGGNVFAIYGNNDTIDTTIAGHTIVGYSGTSNVLNAYATGTATGSNSCSVSLTTNYNNAWLIGVFGNDSGQVPVVSGDLVSNRSGGGNFAFGDSNGAKNAGSYTLTAGGIFGSASWSAIGTSLLQAVPVHQ